MNLDTLSIVFQFVDENNLIKIKGVNKTFRRMSNIFLKQYSKKLHDTICFKSYLKTDIVYCNRMIYTAINNNDILTLIKVMNKCKPATKPWMIRAMCKKGRDDMIKYLIFRRELNNYQLYHAYILITSYMRRDLIFFLHKKDCWIKYNSKKYDKFIKILLACNRFEKREFVAYLCRNKISNAMCEY